MKPRKPLNRRVPQPCDEVGPDDGVDPRTFFRKPSRKGTNRKALQLCGQIARTLGSLLTWESGDELLHDLNVESVQPAPDSTRVLVTVSVPANVGDRDHGRVLEHLHRATGMLRTEVAAAIHRKRVPELVFRVVRLGEVNP